MASSKGFTPVSWYRVGSRRRPPGRPERPGRRASGGVAAATAEDPDAADRHERKRDAAEHDQRQRHALVAGVVGRILRDRAGAAVVVLVRDRALAGARDVVLGARVDA